MFSVAANREERAGVWCGRTKSRPPRTEDDDGTALSVSNVGRSISPVLLMAK
jgi:hypothetical protein